MRSLAFADFLIGLGILFVLEGLLFAASPAWMRRAMKSALATPDNILRVVGIGSAAARLMLLTVVRRQYPFWLPPPKNAPRTTQSSAQNLPPPRPSGPL